MTTRVNVEQTGVRAVLAHKDDEGLSLIVVNADHTAVVTWPSREAALLDAARIIQRCTNPNE